MPCGFALANSGPDHAGVAVACSNGTFVATVERGVRTGLRPLKTGALVGVYHDGPTCEGLTRAFDGAALRIGEAGRELAAPEDLRLALPVQAYQLARGTLWLDPFGLQWSPLHGAGAHARLPIRAATLLTLSKAGLPPVHLSVFDQGEFGCAMAQVDLGGVSVMPCGLDPLERPVGTRAVGSGCFELLTETLVGMNSVTLRRACVDGSSITSHVDGGTPLEFQPVATVRLPEPAFLTTAWYDGRRWFAATGPSSVVSLAPGDVFAHDEPLTREPVGDLVEVQAIGGRTVGVSVRGRAVDLVMSCEDGD